MECEICTVGRLKVTEIAVVDEIASAAELVMGKSEGIPVAIVRGYRYLCTEISSVSKLPKIKRKGSFQVTNNRLRTTY